MVFDAEDEDRDYPVLKDESISVCDRCPCAVIDIESCERRKSSTLFAIILRVYPVCFRVSLPPPPYFLKNSTKRSYVSSCFLFHSV